jgi:hypothetical protein
MKTTGTEYEPEMSEVTGTPTPELGGENLKTVNDYHDFISENESPKPPTQDLPEEQKGWEERFNKQFVFEKSGNLVNSSKHIKAFISQVESSARRSAIDCCIKALNTLKYNDGNTLE